MASEHEQPVWKLVKHPHQANCGAACAYQGVKGCHQLRQRGNLHLVMKNKLVLAITSKSLELLELPPTTNNNNKKKKKEKKNKKNNSMFKSPTIYCSFSKQMPWQSSKAQTCDATAIPRPVPVARTVALPSRRVDVSLYLVYVYDLWSICI